MVSTREIVLDLLREILKPRFLLGIVCASSVIAAFLPLIYCCSYPRWVNTASISGFAVWFVSSLFGVLGAESSEQRTPYIFVLIAAPLVYFFMFSASVSH
jgi:hypothetical protein